MMGNKATRARYRFQRKGIKQITCSYKLLTVDRQQITEQLTGIFRKTFNDERIVVNDARKTAR